MVSEQNIILIQSCRQGFSSGTVSYKKGLKLNLALQTPPDQIPKA
jgi:hypothetical protein